MTQTVFQIKLLIFSRVNYSEDKKCSAEQDSLSDVLHLLLQSWHGGVAA